MKITELMKEVEEDFNFTKENIGEKVFSAPSLHSKYLNLYLREFTKYTNMYKQIKQMYRKKYYYYKEDFSYSLSQKEIDFHIDSDDDYADLYKQYCSQKAIVDYLDSIVKKSQQISFDIKNIQVHLDRINGVV
ncbi:recombination mediator protein UvsY [uncultured Arcobacter sp.]|uniref:recombination mediator protein UvsY n=1 Tax=uncultured Arcobacter sp. TaxID=165434 RepID=UPI00261F1D35|nr:recombination mediator protein UvsY [uncultured Arcobacter sp.]